MRICKSYSRGRSFIALPLITTVFLAFLAGCSSTGTPIAEMSAAKTALIAAESEGAQQYSPVAMDRAKEKLKRAEAANANQKYDEARRLAEEAQADAELAQAVADQSETELAVKELEDSIQILREEIERARSR